jgi:hypothetical protein
VADLEFHPVADIFPLMEGEAFDLLCEDIAAHGQREKILLADGKVADGRNRYRACVKLGREPDAEVWDGKGSLTSLVVSRNLHRRHLTTSQLGLVGAKVAESFEAEAKVSQQAGLNRGKAEPSPVAPKSGRREKPERKPRSAEKAAEAVGVGKGSVEAGQKVLRNGAPEVIAAVQADQVSVSDAAKVAELPHEEQVEALEAVEAGEAPTMAKAAEQKAPKPRKSGGPRYNWKALEGHLRPICLAFDEIIEAYDLPRGYGKRTGIAESCRKSLETEFAKNNIPPILLLAAASDLLATALKDLKHSLLNPSNGKA